MPLLPKPYPDEVVGGVVERACYQSGLSVRRMVQSLFGNSRSHLSFLMGSNLSDLARTMGIDSEELLTLHTMYPYAVAYMPTSEHRKVRSKFLRREDDECIGSITKNVSHSVSSRRLCPQCLSEDLKRYGETYWRRSHLLPGVFFCMEHQAELVETDVRLNGNVLFRKVVLPHETETTNCLHLIQKQISNVLQEISLVALRGKVEARDDWPQAYKQMALQNGYGMTGGDIAARRLAADLHAFYGTAFLQSLRCNFPKSGLRSWPSLMLRISVPQNYSTPKHVLLHTFFRLYQNSTAEFGYDQPGKKTTNFEKSDTESVGKLLKLLKAHASSYRRFTVQELLTELGIWQLYRHNRNQYPLLSEQLARFRASNQSARQIGMRPYWRRRLRSRVRSNTEVD
jgi:hypothetical protein